jgi:HD-GYP domain-containing protein (c-di-GMP phosphodiesterase class II)
MFNRSLDRVQPGEVLGRTIYEPQGRPLLVAGTALTERYIRSLQQRGYRSVYIRDGLADDIVPSELISDRVRSTITDHVATTFSQVSMLATERGLGGHGVDSATARLGDRPLQLVDDGDDLVGQLYADVEALITELLETDTVAGLESLKTHNEYTFQHSVDVAVIGVLLGKHLRMPRERLRELALGCLLHDLGKIYIDQAILDKAGQLTKEEFDAIKEHPRMGFELIRRMPIASLLPAHVAYQHHERQSGAGYPQGLIGGASAIARIHHEQAGAGKMLLIAEIGAVADVYSALSSDRPYRAALTPDVTIKTLRDMAGPHLHPEIVEALGRLVPSYPVGHWIEVTGGVHAQWRGVVTELPYRELHRPTVRLLLDEHGEQVTSPVELDLREHPAVELRCLAPDHDPTERQAAATTDRTPSVA